MELDELNRSIMRSGSSDGNARQDQDVSVPVAAGSQRATADNMSDMEDRRNEDDEGMEFTEEEMEIKKRIEEVMLLRKRPSSKCSLPALHRVPRNKLTGLSLVIGTCKEKHK